MPEKCWSFSAGSKPHTVVVYERKPGGPLYARAWDSSMRSFKRVSLGHKDKQKAKRYATNQAAKLQTGEAEIAEYRASLIDVFSLYTQHRTPRKSTSEQLADARRVEMWTRVLGKIDPLNISLAKWEGFIDDRASGAIDARGNPVKEKDRKPVRSRVVEADCKWLRLVFNWAVKWRLQNARYLLRENPVRGFPIPTEKNPSRPVASPDYFERLREAANGHVMELRNEKIHKKVPSYLPELLDIAAGTGRRISAICALRYSDLRLEKTKAAPYGCIVWPEATDKQGREWIAPISPMVRTALNRVLKARPGIGAGYLFPAPANPSECVSKRLACRWYAEAEKTAGLGHVKGQGWHSLRRAWATARKGMPDADVMQVGGWRSLAALKASYQMADAETMLQVVLAGQLREAK